MLRKMPDQLHRIPIFCLMLKKKGGEWQWIKLSHAEPNLTVLKRLLKPQEFGCGWNWPNKSLQTSYSMILAFFDLVYELLMMALGFLQIMQKNSALSAGFVSRNETFKSSVGNPNKTFRLSFLHWGTFS